MSDIEKFAKNATMLNGNVFPPMQNGANKTSGLQKQYLQDKTQAYAQMNGEIASDCYIAECQGLNKEDFFEWRTIKIRSAKAALAITGALMPDDWQKIHIIDPPNMTYIPQGAYIKYNNNTWIVYKAQSIGTVIGNAIIRRCNAIIHLMDWYGNIVGVPISFSKMETLGNASHQTENTIVSKNYMNCICQWNEYSDLFDENTRFILGRTAYAMRGINDFTREFTDDPNSVHMLTFTIERTEVQAHDNVELQCADYYGFSWELQVNWNSSMLSGTTQSISVSSIRNGAEVFSTEEKPIEYLYSSSDENVITIDENGVITAVNDGEAEITVTLKQNPNTINKVSIKVTSVQEKSVVFTSTYPAYLHEMDFIDISASVFENGVKTEDEVVFEVSGVPNVSYMLTQENNACRIYCYQANAKPMVVTAKCGEYSNSISITLVP